MTGGTGGGGRLEADFLTRRVVKGKAPAMMSTYIYDHNLGAQPCRTTTKN